MALLKSKTLHNGASGDYWRITRISADDTHRVADVWLSLYRDSALAATPEVEPLDEERFTWSGDDYPFTKAALDTGINVYAAAYYLICKSRLSEQPDDWGVTNPGETFVPVETNWFADAVGV